MFRVPVPSGNHLVVVMDGTGATREQDLHFVVGEPSRMERQAVPEVRPVTAAAPVRLFVVEDQPALLKNLLKVLSAFPELEVVGSAQDGEAAVERDRPAQRPQLVLLDLELPGIDGIEVTRRLKRRAPEVEVLILTVVRRRAEGVRGDSGRRLGLPGEARGPGEDPLGHPRGDGRAARCSKPIIAKRFWNYFQSVQAQPQPPPRRTRGA